MVGGKAHSESVKCTSFVPLLVRESIKKKKSPHSGACARKSCGVTVTRCPASLLSWSPDAFIWPFDSGWFISPACHTNLTNSWCIHIYIEREIFPIFTPLPYWNHKHFLRIGYDLPFLLLRVGFTFFREIQASEVGSKFFLFLLSHLFHQQAVSYNWEKYLKNYLKRACFCPLQAPISKL